MTQANNKNDQNGFTLIELIVSMGILGVLFALTSLTITRLPSANAQTNSLDLLISDLRSEQTKAMTGYGGLGYGISFSDTSYTLLSDNFLVSLDPNLEFTNDQFPLEKIQFSTGSGEFVNYLSGQDNIGIKNKLTGEVKTVRINKYGAAY